MTQQNNAADNTQDRRLMLAGIGLAGAAIVGGLARVAKAGDLNPPPGPIGSTGRTISEVYDRVATGGEHASPEPRKCIQDLPGSPTAMFVIEQPGAYYLSGPVQAQAGLLCIEVRCSHVDIDGGGFPIIGVLGMV